jgi:hypothetical protein
MFSNFGDFQMGVYADAVKGVNSRYPFDFRSTERKAAEPLPDWIAGQGPGHAFRAPELFTADTPLCHYQGVTDQVQMSTTPRYYDPVLVPLGSCYPEWKVTSWPKPSFNMS